MSRRWPPPIEKPDKPLAAMTSAERAASLGRLRCAQRDDEVRRGRRRPKTMREVEIWHEALAARPRGSPVQSRIGSRMDEPRPRKRCRACDTAVCSRCGRWYSRPEPPDILA